MSSSTRRGALVCAAALLMVTATPVSAEVVLDDIVAQARAAAERAIEQETRSRGVRGRTVSTLQIGCDGADVGRACQRASTSVEIGNIERSNTASGGGFAIQETLIGTAR